MNEELHEIVTEVQKKEDQEGKEQDKIIEKLTQLKIEDKRVEGLKDYLKNNGINLAFQVIFSEIVTKKIEKEQVFAYTAMRLRQIGNDLNQLKKKDGKV